MAPAQKPQETLEGREQEAQLMNGRVTLTSRVPQYGATIVVDILHLIYGLGIGWSTIALPALMDQGSSGNHEVSNITNITNNNTDAVTNSSSNEFTTFRSEDINSSQTFRLTLAEGSWVTAVPFISAVPSMPIYGYICERWGRKMCGNLIGVPYVASALIIAWASSFPAIIIGRALLGMSSGGIFVFAPLYVAEIVEDAVRGKMGAFVTLMRNVGILVTYVLGTFLTYKQFEYIAILPTVVFLVVFYWMPESPVFLLRQKKVTQAEKGLRWLRGSRADVLEELDKMQESLTATKSESARSATLKDLFATPGRRRAFIISIFLSINQQFCGFFGVISYTFMIFGEASPSLKNISNVIVGSMMVVGIGASMLIYDKARRKVLLMISNILMMLALFVLSLYFYYKSHGSNVSEFGWLPVTAMSIYVIGYSSGVASLPIVIYTEIFSPQIRNIGLTINGMFTWFIIFVVTKTFPMMVKEIGFHGACWFYIVWCVIGSVAILTLLPETRNRSLESILDELEHGKKKMKQKLNSQTIMKFNQVPPLTNDEKKENNGDECTL